jgi:hypothetical protein
MRRYVLRCREERTYLTCREAFTQVSSFWEGVTVFRGGIQAELRQKFTINSSVADPGCLSRLPDSNFFHPGSRIPIFPSRIPDPYQRILARKIVSKLSEI